MSYESDRLMLEAQIRSLEGRLARATRAHTPDELNQLGEVQMRADSVAAHYGERAAPPLPGESVLDYKRRQIGAYQKHSPQFCDARAGSIPAEIVDSVSEIVYRDAKAAAMDPANYKPGELRAIRERDESGRVVTKYVGDPMAWMAPFCTPARRGYFIDPRKK